MREGKGQIVIHGSVFIAIYILVTASITAAITIDEINGNLLNKPKSGSYELMDGDLVIDGDDDFEDYSHITGNGTQVDPYIISGLDMDEYCMKIKNTTSFFTITDIKWATNLNDYRLVFRNNVHITIDNLTIDTRFMIDGDECDNLIINNSRITTDTSDDLIIFYNLNSLVIKNSIIKSTEYVSYHKANVEFYGNDSRVGNTIITNSIIEEISLYSQIYGYHLVENCTFNSTFLIPMGMSTESEIKYNSFSIKHATCRLQLYRYSSGCNYGRAHHNTFKGCDRAISIWGDNKMAPLIFHMTDNSFENCEEGIQINQETNININNNLFLNCSSYAIKTYNCFNNKIWRNCFINNNYDTGDCQVYIENTPGSNYKNQWDVKGIGNYWSDHSYPDLDGNGIVDTPYNITNLEGDSNPVTNRNYDIEKPELFITSHSSGRIEKSYNRIGWEAKDEYGIVKVEFNGTSGSYLDVTGREIYPVFLDNRTHNISIKAIDGNGLFRIESVHLELERTYPVINFTTVSNGYYMDYDPVPIQWDIVEYFPVVKQNFTIDGTKSILETDVREKNLVIEEGPHSISITLTDDLGFEITESVDFIVDRNAPSIELKGLSPGSELSSRTVNFDCRILEIVGLDYVRYRFNDKDWVFEDENFSVERVLDEGSHVFRIEALDVAGHLSELEIPFKISNEGLVEVLSPENGTVFNKDTIDLEWTYGGKFLWSEAFLRLGADKEFFSIGTSYEYEMDFPEDGEYLVTLRLMDEVGNYIQSDLLVIKDTKDPTVGFLDADEINHINTWKFDLNWNAVDDNGIDHYELKVDEKDWDDRGLETTKEVGLTEGEHTITIRAYDLAGNMDEAQISVIVDVTPPELEFEEMDVFTSTSIEIEWKANDLYGIKNMFITIGDMKQNDVTDKDSYSVVLNQDGIFDVILNATDLAGNLETITTTIVVDTTEPRAIWKDTSIEITNETDLKLEWEIDEDVGIQSLYLTIDGNKIDLDGNDTSYIADLEDGTHSISLTVIDIGGWQYTLDYPHDILVDSTPPTFQFDSKEIGTDGKAVIQWTVSDDGNGLTVMISVDGENYIEVPGTSYTTGSLPPGDHTIQLIIMDSAGNQVDETWTFTIEEEKDEESGGSGGFIAVIILIAVVLIIGIIGAVIFIFKKKGKEPEEKQDAKVTVPSGPPGIGSKKVDNNMLKAPPVNQMRELPPSVIDQKERP